MIFYAISFLIGIVIFSEKNSLFLTNLEIIIGYFIIIVLIFIITKITTITRENYSQKNEYFVVKKYKITATLLFFFILGFLWNYIYSYNVLVSKVEKKYLDKPIVVVGTVVSLVTVKNSKTNFLLQTTSPFDAKLKLNWYHKNTKIPNIKTGDIWQLRVKLKENNGLKNKAGFDYERALFLNAIDATGYVRISNDLTSSSSYNKFLRHDNNHILAQIRQKIKFILLPFLNDLNTGGIIYALISGQRTDIKDEQWQKFQKTNTSHLTVVSGLHIGIIGGIMFYLALIIYKLCTKCCLRMPAQIFASYIGIISTLFYALLAGFSVSTQRAFIMASIVFLSIILRKKFLTWHLYSYALFAVLLINPLSVLSIGFWLSFIAVALILYGINFIAVVINSGVPFIFNY